MATINTAEWFGLDRRGLGAVAPGRVADIVVLSDLEGVAVESVFVAGRPVVRSGELQIDIPTGHAPLPPSVHLDLDRFPGFDIPAHGELARVIDVIPGQIVTGHSVERPSSYNFV